MAVSLKTCGGIADTNIHPILIDYEDGHYSEAKKQIIELQNIHPESAYVPGMTLSQYGLVNCCVSSVLKEQQTALSMYKLSKKEEHLLRVVCCIQLQVHHAVDGTRLLSLAEGLLKRHVAAHGLITQEALLAYISVLELEHKYEAALAVLKDFEHVLVNKMDLLHLKAKLVTRACKYASTTLVSKEILQLSNAQWEIFVNFMENLLQDNLHENKISSTVQKSPTSPAIKGQMNTRGPYWMKVENDGDKRLFGKDEMEDINYYFHSFFIMLGEYWLQKNVPRSLPEKKFVVYLTSPSGMTHIIMVAGSYSVYTLKCVISSKFLIVPELYWISFAWKPLLDRFALSFYTITDGSVINLNFCLCGGRGPRLGLSCSICGLPFTKRRRLLAHQAEHPNADAAAAAAAVDAATARRLLLDDVLTRLAHWLNNTMSLEHSVYYQKSLEDFSGLTVRERQSVSDKCYERVRRQSGFDHAIHAKGVCESLRSHFATRPPDKELCINSKKQARKTRKEALKRERELRELNHDANSDIVYLEWDTDDEPYEYTLSDFMPEVLDTDAGY